MREEFSVGAVLGTGFKVWLKNFIPFFLITALIYTPVVLWGVLTVQGQLTLDKLHDIVIFSRYSAVLTFLLNIFVSAAITFGVIKELQGERASIGACIGTGFARFFPVLGVALLSGLIVGLGAILLVIPGLMFLCSLYVATPASVIERPGVGGALSRSRELTAGHRWGIFGLIIVLGIFGYVLQKIVEKAIFDPTRFEETMRPYIYADLLRTIIIGSLGSVMSAVAYYYLRSSKDGTTASELARVFE